jgi:tripartite-type tricarboxylate transporter receptor subunit TctC
MNSEAQMKLPCTYKLALAVLVALAAFQHAQAQNYPSKPVKVIRPHPPGSPGDTNARGIMQSLSQTLGQPFLVENRVGADGIIGAEACARAAPDGYTLCGTDDLVTSLNPVIRTKLPYEPMRDFSPIVHLGFLDIGLLVHPSVPANSTGELLALAKAKPGSITWATWGVSSLSHLFVEWLKNAKGISFYGVPYKSATQATQGLVGGEVQVAIYGLGLALPMAKGGKLKILAVTGDKRSSIAPELPSVKEAGLDMSLRTWYGLFAPTGTPREIVQRLNAEVGKLLADPGFREKFMTSVGLEYAAPAGGPPEAFAAFLKADRELYARLVKTAGITPE